MSDILNNPGIQHEREVAKLCRVLKTYIKVPHFTYLNIYDDGSRATLSSNADSIVCNYVNLNIFNQFYTPKYHNHLQQYFYVPEWAATLPSFAAKNIDKSLSIQKEKADLSSEFIILKRSPGFLRFFIFAGYAEQKGFLNQCINQLGPLDAFCTNFMKSGKRLIQEAVDNRIVKPWIDNEKDNTRIIDPKKHWFYSELTGGEFYLTHKEHSYTNLLLQGKTYKAIATRFGLSQRTIETHMENIRNRLGCNSKSYLIEILLQSIPVW